MAKFITSNSKFNPYSLQDLLIPIQMYNEEYDKQEAALNDAAAKADAIKSIVNAEAEDSEIRRSYNSYQDELNNQLNQFNSTGLNLNNRRSLNALKRNYTSTILPIEDLIKRREELTKEQRLMNKDGKTLFTSDYGGMSLDDFAKVNNPTYRSVSGTSIAADAHKLFGAVAAGKLDDMEFQKGVNSIKGYILQKQQQGYTPEQALGMLDKEVLPPEIKGVYDSIKGGIGSGDYNSIDQKRIDSFINEGLYSLIGKQSQNLINDKVSDFNDQMSLIAAKNVPKVDNKYERIYLGDGKYDKNGLRYFRIGGVLYEEKENPKGGEGTVRKVDSDFSGIVEPTKTTPKSTNGDTIINASGRITGGSRYLQKSISEPVFIITDESGIKNPYSINEETNKFFTTGDDIDHSMLINYYDDDRVSTVNLDPSYELSQEEFEALDRQEYNMILDKVRKRIGKKTLPVDFNKYHTVYKVPRRDGQAGFDYAVLNNKEAEILNANAGDRLERIKQEAADKAAAKAVADKAAATRDSFEAQLRRDSIAAQNPITPQPKRDSTVVNGFNNDSTSVIVNGQVINLDDL